MAESASETWDGFLNDINGFHVRKEHVFQVLDNARGGVVAEGNVGGGTGMVTHRFNQRGSERCSPLDPGGFGAAPRARSASSPLPP
jgi:L-aminopeptidase/D-esterase-like protein